MFDRNNIRTFQGFFSSSWSVSTYSVLSKEYHSYVGLLCPNCIICILSQILSFFLTFSPLCNAGATVETVVHGKRRLTLMQRQESYVMNSPKLLIRLLPKPGVEWVGNVKIECQETGLTAELSYKGSSFFGFGGGRSIRGKIIDSSSLNTLYEIDGQWDRSVKIRDTSDHDGKIKVIYNAKEAISSLPTLFVKDHEGVWESESAVIWAEVSNGIVKKEWEKARDAKRHLEDKERELARQRKSKGENWVPKHFHLSYTPENGWVCSPKHKTIPPAPIISPI